jgi:hypothetical protein
MRAATAICGLMIALAIASPAVAQHSEAARRHFIEGRKFFKQSKFNDAVRSFNAAYKLRPSPLLDYNIGRCHDELGQRGLAIAAFKRYLDARPNATNREEVLDRIAKLEAAAKPPPDGPAQAPVKEREPAAAAPTEPREPQPPVATATTPPVHEAAASARVPPPSAVEEPGVPAIKGQRSPKVAAAGGAAPAHEATLPPGRKGAQRQHSAKPKDRPRSRPRHKAPGRPDSGPIYKQWWFWVGCGAAAVIAGFIIGTAASRSDSGDAHKSTGGLQITF